LVARRRHGRFELRHVPLPGRAPARRAARVEAPVGGDRVQPGAQRRAFLSEPADALPGGQHRLLDGVLGVLEGSEHPVAVHLQLPPMRLGQLPERLAIPGPRPGEKIGCHHPAHLPSRTTSSLRPSIYTAPVYTPPTARTGRLAGAQFPSAAVYALPTAGRSAHRIVPHQLEPTLVSTTVSTQYQ